MVSQYMLIWYAEYPRGSNVLHTRIEMYNMPRRCCYEFVFPLLILINTDFKRIGWVLVMAG
jgi:hypothetical protein